MHFALTGAVMALHYQTFIEKLHSCPITLAYGTSGTGKTTAIHCGLALLGMNFASTTKFQQPRPWNSVP